MAVIDRCVACNTPICWVNGDDVTIIRDHKCKDYDYRDVGERPIEQGRTIGTKLIDAELIKSIDR